MQIEHHMVDPFHTEVPADGCDLVCRAGCGSIHLASNDENERSKAKVALDKLAPLRYGVKVFHVG